MFGRSKTFIALFLMTTVVPYVLSTSAKFNSLVAQYMPSKSGDKASPEASPTEPGAPRAEIAKGDPATPKPPSLKTTPFHSLEEVLRFDVTTNWVLSNWPRVSADLAELDLQGYRVPLITGTSDADVAGSLTYYFNPKQRVARITFFGTTGDTRRLVAYLESQYGFQRKETPEPNLFLYQVKSWTWGQVTSELRMRPASVVRSEVPNSRFEVALLMDRPKSMD
ncbi:MAG TPA: DUF6690 family protein [Pirellulales bacterium]|jgi:hypothetical protein